MENKNCLSAIKSKYRNLTKKERQLADYVLENFEAVVPMSTAELARNAGMVFLAAHERGAAHKRRKHPDNTEHMNERNGHE